MVDNLPATWVPEWGKSVFYRADTSDMGTLQDVVRDRDHIPSGEWRPSRILDLGANVGYTVIDYRTWARDAEIVGVEMDDENVTVAARNGVALRRAAVVPSPLCGTPVSYERPAFNAGRVGPGDHQAPGMCLACLHAHTFDLIKFDIEGMEQAVIETDGPVLSRVKCLVVEVHEPMSSYGDVAHELNVLGFNVFHHPRHPWGLVAWNRT